MSATKQNTYRISIFRKRINQDKIRSRGLYQRFIIISLATRPSTMTKRALARLVAQRFGISVRAAYEHILKELNECLIPRGIVQEAGSIPPYRGPKIFQIIGDPSTV